MRVKRLFGCMSWLIIIINITSKIARAEEADSAKLGYSGRGNSSEDGRRRGVHSDACVEMLASKRCQSARK